MDGFAHTFLFLPDPYAPPPKYTRDVECLPVYEKDPPPLPAPTQQQYKGSPRHRCTCPPSATEGEAQASTSTSALGSNSASNSDSEDSPPATQHRQRRPSWLAKVAHLGRSHKCPRCSGTL